MLPSLCAAASGVAAPPAAPNPPLLVPGYCTAYGELDGLCNAAVMQAFAELKPGQTVGIIHLDLNSVAGAIGYFAHTLSKIVGPGGHVYVVSLPEQAKYRARQVANGQVVAGDYQDGNVTQVAMPLADVATLPKLDVLWAGEGRESLFDVLKPSDTASLKSLHGAVKPGGLFIIVDAETEIVCTSVQHDCGETSPKALGTLPHGAWSIRRDEAASLIEHAGFKLESETSALRDPQPGSAGPIPLWGADAAAHIEGHPFIWKFRQSAE